MSSPACFFHTSDDKSNGRIGIRSAFYRCIGNRQLIDIFLRENSILCRPELTQLPYSYGGPSDNHWATFPTMLLSSDRSWNGSCSSALQEYRWRNSRLPTGRQSLPVSWQQTHNLSESSQVLPRPDWHSRTN